MRFRLVYLVFCFGGSERCINLASTILIDAIWGNGYFERCIVLASLVLIDAIWGIGYSERCIILASTVLIDAIWGIGYSERFRMIYSFGGPSIASVYGLVSGVAIMLNAVSPWAWFWYLHRWIRAKFWWPEHGIGYLWPGGQ